MIINYIVAAVATITAVIMVSGVGSYAVRRYQNRIALQRLMAARRKDIQRDTAHQHLEEEEQ